MGQTNVDACLTTAAEKSMAVHVDLVGASSQDINVCTSTNNYGKSLEYR